MAFTEFCCRSGGSNLNAGTRTGNSTEPGTSAFKTYTSGTWVQSTRTFTPAGGANPSSDGIAVGDFVSVYPDAATVSPYVARITTVTTTTFVTDAAAKAGTAPVDGVLNTSASIGGAWKGPNGAENFPFNFITAALTNSSTNRPRVNLKNDATYNITSGITHNLAGPSAFQGYGSAYGDGGRATIDGGTSGASYILLSIGNSWNDLLLVDMIFQNNGATGSAAGIDTITGGGAAGLILRCVVNNVRGHGFANSQSSFSFRRVECEAYKCNQSNTADLGGFHNNANEGGTMIRCISHDNDAGANCHGFVGRYLNLLSCIADSNAGSGAKNTNNNNEQVFCNCDFYNNGGSGIIDGSGGGGGICYYIENCNFIKNAAYGINLAAGGGTKSGYVFNCGFGAGTQANTSGSTNIPTTGSIVEVSGSVTYANDVTPWVDPANGDFRISLAAAINAGRGAFTETAASYSGTIGYPDIGAAQHLESAAISVITNVANVAFPRGVMGY